MSQMQFSVFDLQKSVLLESLLATVNASAGSWGNAGQAARQVPRLSWDVFSGVHISAVH